MIRSLSYSYDLKLSNDNLLTPSAHSRLRRTESSIIVSEPALLPPELETKKQLVKSKIELDFPVFNIEIDPENVEENMKTILHHFFPNENVEEITLKKLTGGITNQLFKVDNMKKPKSVLIRISGANTEAIIDRDQEILTLVCLGQVGIAPKLYGRFSGGIVYGFVQGSTFTVEDMKDDQKSILVAKYLAYYHAKADVVGIPRQPILFQTLKNWLAEASSGTIQFLVPLIDKLNQHNISFKFLANEIQEMEEQFNLNNIRVAYCHNDLLAGNIIYDTSEDEPQIHFIDFEYGGYNYCGFDIGNHFCEMMGFNVDRELFPSTEFQLRWLTAYLKASYEYQELPEPEDFDFQLQQFHYEVSHFVLVAHLFWGIWSLIQYQYSEKKEEFNYLDYSIQRLEAYQRDKEYVTKML